MAPAESNSETNRSFDVGDIAVFPGAGVGKIEQIESQEHNGMPYEVYVLKFFSSDNEMMCQWSLRLKINLRQSCHQKD